MTRPFKAIFKVSAVRSCRAHQLYQGAPTGESSSPELTAPEGRAGVAHGDMRGWAELTQDDLEAGEDFGNISFVSGVKPRALLLTLEHVIDPADRAVAKERIEAAMKAHFDRELPHSPYRFRVHLDRPAPHAEAIFIPLSADGERLDIRPCDLRRWQDFRDADDLIAGRGSREFSRHPRPPGPGEEHAQEVASARQKGRGERQEKLDELRDLLSKQPLKKLISEGRVQLDLSSGTRRGIEFDSVKFRQTWLEKNGHDDIVSLIGLPGSRRTQKQDEPLPSVRTKKTAPASDLSDAAKAVQAAQIIRDLVLDPAKAANELAEKAALKIAEKIIPGVGHLSSIARVFSCQGSPEKSLERVAQSAAEIGAKAVISLVPGGAAATAAVEVGTSLLVEMVTDDKAPPSPVNPEDKIPPEERERRRAEGARKLANHFKRQSTPTPAPVEPEQQQKHPEIQL